MIELERPVVRLFVGTGDFPTMRPIEQKRRNAGWYMAQVADRSDRKYDLAHRQFKDAIVVIHGSCPGACVAYSVIDALNEGAYMVRAPLQYMMSEDEGSYPILKRAREFARAVPDAYLRDPRLFVSPNALMEFVREEVLRSPHLATGYRTFPKYQNLERPTNLSPQYFPVFAS